MKSAINVICIKWGDEYNVDDVNKLHRMVKKNTKLNVDFYCFTENSVDLDEEIIIKPLPILDTIEEYQNKYAYKKEAGLCDDNLGGLVGQRVFFLI